VHRRAGVVPEARQGQLLGPGTPADGVLGLADPIERWLPGVVPDSTGITIELLLRLRSGIADYVPALLDGEPELAAFDRYFSPEELVRTGVASGDRFEPGTQFRYSNTDYILLGLIAERATGQRLAAQLWQRVFAPAGLRETYFPEADTRIRGPHATGYVRLRPGHDLVECSTFTPSAA